MHLIEVGWLVGWLDCFNTQGKRYDAEPFGLLNRGYDLDLRGITLVYQWISCSGICENCCDIVSSDLMCSWLF